MELGCDGVLLNTAIAHAQDPLSMAWAMRYGCDAGRLAFLAGRIPRKMYAQAFEEQEKLVKYTGLLTNCIILDNTLEISAALNALAREGYRPSIDELAALSPYQTRHIKRFGNYEIDFSAVPALIADDLTFQLELPAPPEVIEAVQEN